jgi:hypothetical protein
MNQTTRPLIQWRFLTQLGFGLVVLMISASVRAAWLVEPAIAVSTGYDDNVQLSADDKQDAIISDVTAQVRLRRVTESSEVAAIVGISYLSYVETDATDLDDEDAQFVALNSSKTLKRGTFGLRGDLRRDRLLRRVAAIPDVLSASSPLGEEEDQGPAMTEDIDDPLSTSDIDVNATRQQVRRTRVYLRPYLNYQLGELTTAELAYAFSDRSFSGGQQTNLSDTQTHEVTFGLRRDFSPRVAMNLNLGVARFEADGVNGQPDGEADNYTATLGVDSRLTPQTRLSVDVGASRSEDQNSDLEETEFIYDVRFTRFMRVSQVSIGANRSTLPSAFGGLVRADRVVLDYQQLLGERVEFSISAYGYRTERLGDAGTARDNRDYFDISPRLTWRVREAWNVGISYRYRWTKRDFSGSADGNFVSLFLSFQPLSRI